MNQPITGTRTVVKRNDQIFKMIFCLLNALWSCASEVFLTAVAPLPAIFVPPLSELVICFGGCGGSHRVICQDTFFLSAAAWGQLWQLCLQLHGCRQNAAKHQHRWHLWNHLRPCGWSPLAFLPSFFWLEPLSISLATSRAAAEFPFFLSGAERKKKPQRFRLLHSLPPVYRKSESTC